MAKSNKELIYAFLEHVKNKHGIDYLNDEHCIGILFYGSRMGEYTTSTSDLDLSIIYDDTIDYYIKGIETIEGVDVEYFVKNIDALKKSVIKDYNTINSAPLSMYGQAEVVFERNGKMSELQNYIKEMFAVPFNKPSLDEIRKDIFLVKNRMDILRSLAAVNDINFELFFYTTLDRIKTVYHKVNAITRLEISKAIRSYVSLDYAKTLLVDDIINTNYKKLFIDTLNSTELTSMERYEQLEKLYKLLENGILDKDDQEIPVEVKHVFTEFIPFYDIGLPKPKLISSTLNEKINEFIKLNKYEEDNNFVGIILYGDALINDGIDEIEVLVLFNDCNHKVKIGCKKVLDSSIKYTETGIYQMGTNNEICDFIYHIDNKGFLINANTYYQIYAKDDDSRVLLVDYFDKIREKNTPTCTESRYKEELSIIKNRIERLIKFSKIDYPNYFDMYYNIILGKIISLYRKKIGSTFISSDDLENELFLNLFKSAISERNAKETKLEKILMIYNYIRGTIEFEDNYMIKVPEFDFKEKKRIKKFEK